ncbi:hypothetical protein DWV00_30185 [Trinickia dinghuensis]|uniref:Uncharacterized protein n=1 Tax=Trinickia dinghuensis TaxID=2291023 RepID=A0A3D8JRA5_9BURK|nr:hypothetical protein DWV00_30185 [Trinickia dinghuensis]
MIKRKVTTFSNNEQKGRLSAKNFVNALEARLFPQLAPSTNPPTLFVMNPEGQAWREVPSVQQVTSMQGRALTFAVGLRFFQGGQSVATIILPVVLTSQGDDADFMFGASFQVTSSSSGGNYSHPALTAETLLAQAAASWNYERRGSEEIVVP